MRKAKIQKRNTMNITVQNPEKSDTTDTSEEDSGDDLTEKIDLEHAMLKDVLQEHNIIIGRQSFETFARSRSMKTAIDGAPMLIVTKLLKRARAIGTISEEAINLRKCLKARKNALQKAQNQTQERDSLVLNASDSIHEDEGSLQITVKTPVAKQDTLTNTITHKNDDPNTPGSSGINSHTTTVMNEPARREENTEYTFETDIQEMRKEIDQLKEDIKYTNGSMELLKRGITRVNKDERIMLSNGWMFFITCVIHNNDGQKLFLAEMSGTRMLGLLACSRI